jgi:hypothetical protein
MQPPRTGLIATADDAVTAATNPAGLTRLHEAEWVVGACAGAEYRWGKNRVVGVNLTFYDLGSAPVSTSIPLVGTLSGQFTTNYAIGADLTLRWIR